MKYIVFLLCTICFLVKPTAVYATRTGYSFDFYEIYVDKHLTEEGDGFVLEKTGENPFQTLLLHPYQHITITNVDVKNEIIFTYGYNHIEGDDTYYDGFFAAFSMQGEVLFETSIDCDDLEEVMGVYLVDDTFFVHVRQSKDYGYEFDYTGNYYLLYNNTFQYINTVHIEENYHHEESEFYLLLDLENDGFAEIGMRQDGSLLHHDEPLSTYYLSDEQSTMMVEFLNEAIISNQVLKHGCLLDYPGQYDILYQNQASFHIVEAVIDGVENGTIYEHSVHPTFKKGSAYLNSDLFVSRTEISYPGHYHLVVHGVGNYVKEVSFTITSALVGVEHQQHYDGPQTIEFNGEGYLNEEYITSPYYIEDPGEYTLKILGENNYLDIIEFTIDKDEPSISLLSIVQEIDIFVLGFVLIGGVIVLRKKS